MSRPPTTRKTATEYIESIDTDSMYLSAPLIRFGGWIPIGIVSIVAGIVVAFISGNWLRFLLTVFSGTILGYLAAIGAIFTYSEVDVRWLRLGQMERAWWVIFLSVGPAAVLLMAILVLKGRGSGLVVAVTAAILLPLAMCMVDPGDLAEPPAE